MTALGHHLLFELLSTAGVHSGAPRNGAETRSIAESGARSETRRSWVKLTGCRPDVPLDSQPFV